MELWYPGAVRKPDFSKGSYAGSPMEGNCLCLHSTETTGLPGYRGGATTPHFTTLPDFENEKIEWFQHLPINRSARALENRNGGVETNTFGVIQVEMGGTCDSQYAKTWGSREVNVDYIYTEAPPAWYLTELAKFVVWLDEQLPDFKIENSAEEWRYYRKNGSTTGGSYGATSTRFTSAKWPNVYGIFGHQHAIENSHGDPGAFPCDALVAEAIALRDGTTVPPVVIDDPPDPTLPPTVYDKMDPASYFRGVVGDHVTWYGERIRIWSKELLLPDPYSVGPGPEWGPADERGTQAIQLVWWPGSSTAPGGDADGFPGSQSLPRLAADPPKPAATVEVISAIQNMAGNNVYGIKTAKARMGRYVAARKATPVHVLNAQETTVASTVRPRLDSGLKPFGYTRAGGGEGRYCYTRGVKVIDAGLFTVPSKWWFQRDNKQAAWVVYERDGAIGMDVSMHLESASGMTADNLRVDQAKWIADSALAKAKALHVPEQNVLLTGDTNSEGMVLAALVSAGWRNAADGTDFTDTHTFMGWDGRSRKRFDYALVRHDAAKAEVEAISHDTSIADHAGLRVRRQLTT